MKPITKKTVIHSIVGVLIMIFFRFLPLNLPQVTSMGMAILGIFIGTVYLWITVDPIWSSLLSVCMLVFSSYFSMSDMLVNLLGNSVIMLMIFIMLMSNALSKYGITPYLARFSLTVKLVRGRPYVFVFIMGLIIYLIAAFVGPMAPIFLFWPVLSEVCRDVGYTKKDKFPKLLVIYVVVCSLLGFPVASYMGNALVLLSNFESLTEGTEVVFAVNNAQYIAVALILGLVMMLLMLAMAKFVLRPDVEPFKKLDFKKFDDDPLPLMTASQKFLSAGFVVMLLLMLVPSIIPNAPGMAYLSTLTNGIPLLVAAILCAIPIKGKTIISIQDLLCENFGWGSVFMAASAVILGSALTSDSAGISTMLSQVFSPILTNLGYIPFIVIFLILIFLLTNVMNSLVVGLIFEPIVLTYCTLTGADPMPIIMLMVMICLGTAIITPSASPFAAILHGNKEWTETGDIYKYATFFVVVEMVVYIALGIPLVMAIS